VRGESSGPTVAIVGLGLNVDLSDSDAQRIDQPHAALVEKLPKPIDRNRLAALLITELMSAFDRYAVDGFGAFHADWERLHVHQNCRVELTGADGIVDGLAVGVDARGALRLRQATGDDRLFYAGEVSLRTQLT